MMGECLGLGRTEMDDKILSAMMSAVEMGWRCRDAGMDIEQTRKMAKKCIDPITDHAVKQFEHVMSI